MGVKIGERMEQKAKVKNRSIKGEISSLITEIIQALSPLGSGFTSIVKQLTKLEQRLEQERFQLGVLGQFKRGKSTLLNALLGEEILPTSVLPLTAIPTFLSWGERRGAKVIFQDGKAPENIESDDPAVLKGFLERYVTEQGNPENRRGVARVEVRHPAALLSRGVVLIDTPGIGSTFRHNTTTALSFLPQCDAALFVTAPDPPITEVEAEFLKTVNDHAARLFVVFNKVDYLSADETQKALRFLKEVLREQLKEKDIPKIFPLSARYALQAQRKNDHTLWEKSGFAALNAHLIDFLLHEKERALVEAVAQKAAALINETTLQLDLSIRSLTLPISALKERMKAFKETLSAVERERRVAADLLAGERLRLIEFLEEQAENLRQQGQAHLNEIMDKALEEQGAKIDENAVRKKVADAIPGFFAPQCAALGKRFFTRVSEALRPHRARADALLAKLRQSAAELFDIPYHSSLPVEEFKLTQQPYWVTETYSVSFIPSPMRLIDRLVPAHVRRERIKSRLAEEIETLVLHNVENLRVTTRESLEQTLRWFQRNLDEQFDATLIATHGAIEAAKRKREESADLNKEIVRLQAIKEELIKLKKRFLQVVA